MKAIQILRAVLVWPLIFAGVVAMAAWKEWAFVIYLLTVAGVVVVAPKS